VARDRKVKVARSTPTATSATLDELRESCMHVCSRALVSLWPRSETSAIRSRRAGSSSGIGLGLDVDRLMSRLATYLGHVRIAETLLVHPISVPELLRLVTERLERVAQGGVQ